MHFHWLPSHLNLFMSMLQFMHAARHVDGDTFLLQRKLADAMNGSPSSSLTLAPPLTSVSPFALQQQDASRQVLAQIHPDIGISTSALTILMRIQDRLAHYLLSRAYHGETCTWAKENRFEFKSASEDSPHPEIEENTVLFRFPAHVHADELQRHAQGERVKTLARAEHAAPPIDEFFAVGLQFSLPSAKRWYGDFINGLEVEMKRKKDKESSGSSVLATATLAPAAASTAPTESKEAVEEKKEPTKSTATSLISAFAALLTSSTSPATTASPPSTLFSLPSSSLPLDESLLPLSLQTRAEKIALCCSIEYITAEILELAGNRALDSGDDTIGVVDIWCGLQRDLELYNLIQFLPVDWNVLIDINASPDAPLSYTSTGEGMTGLPEITTLLEKEFGQQSKLMSTLNASSWYQDRTKLVQYAKEFARGDRLESVITKSLRGMNVRPFKFWGADTYQLLSERPSHDESDTDNEEPDPAHGYIFVSVLVEDAAGEEWHLMLEVSPRQNWKGSVIELHSTASPLGHFEQRTVNGVDTLRVHLSFTSQLRKAGGIVYKPRESSVAVSQEELELEQEMMVQLKAMKEKLDAFNAKKAQSLKPQPKYVPLQPVVLPLDFIDKTEQKSDETEQSDILVTTSSSSASSAATLPDATVTATQADSSSFPSSSSHTATFNPLALMSWVPPTTAASGSNSSSASNTASPIVRSALGPKLSYASTSRLELLSESLSQVSFSVTSSHSQSELERIIPNLLHLIRFSHYGPTMYVSNQSLRDRRLFTTIFLDEALRLGGVTDIPDVLLGVIAEYVTFDLPFIEMEAQAQMKSAGGLLFPGTRALYEGQKNHPIERHDQLLNANDHVWLPWGQEEEDGEDPVADEDGDGYGTDEEQ